MLSNVENIDREIEVNLFIVIYNECRKRNLTSTISLPSTKAYPTLPTAPPLATEPSMKNFTSTPLTAEPIKNPLLYPSVPNCNPNTHEPPTTSSA